MKDKKVEIGLSIAGILVFCAILYGSFWVTKNISYSIFYENMVQQTVKEMVKPEYLK